MNTKTFTEFTIPPRTNVTRAAAWFEMNSESRGRITTRKFGGDITRARISGSFHPIPEIQRGADLREKIVSELEPGTRLGTVLEFLCFRKQFPGLFPKKTIVLERSYKDKWVFWIQSLHPLFSTHAKQIAFSVTDLTENCHHAFVVKELS